MMKVCQPKLQTWMAGRPPGDPLCAATPGTLVAFWVGDIHAEDYHIVAELVDDSGTRPTPDEIMYRDAVGLYLTRANFDWHLVLVGTHSVRIGVVYDTSQAR